MSTNSSNSKSLPDCLAAKRKTRCHGVRRTGGARAAAADTSVRRLSPPVCPPRAPLRPPTSAVEADPVKLLSDAASVTDDALVAPVGALPPAATPLRLG